MLQYLVREKAGDLNARAQDGEFQPYRKRITTEKKAKVVAAVWGGGTKFIQFYAAIDFAPG